MQTLRRYHKQEEVCYCTSRKIVGKQFKPHDKLSTMFHPCLYEPHSLNVGHITISLKAKGTLTRSDRFALGCTVPNVNDEQITCSCMEISIALNSISRQQSATQYMLYDIFPVYLKSNSVMKPFNMALMLADFSKPTPKSCKRLPHVFLRAIASIFNLCHCMIFLPAKAGIRWMCVISVCVGPG